VAVQPDLLNNQKLIKDWMMFLADVLQFENEPNHCKISIVWWHDFVLSVCTGRPIPNIRKFGEATTTSEDYFSGYLGYHKDGIFLIMDILLRPSVCRQSILEFHIQYGQPLQLPVSDDGFITAEPALVYTRDPCGKVDLPTTNVLSPLHSDCKVKIDLEPCWETNPRTVIFRSRVDGVLVCSFSPDNLLCPLTGQNNRFHFVTCDCELSSDKITVPVPGRPWTVMKISQFLVSNFTPTRVDFGVIADEICDWMRPIYINASGDVGAQVLCATAGHAFRNSGFNMIFASKCRYCALQLYPLDQEGDPNGWWLLVDGR
jgi:hypothetical protein